VSIVRYVAHTPIYGYDYKANEVDRGGSVCDEVLDEEITYYMCSNCRNEIIIPESYGDADNQIAVWLNLMPGYQKEK
jgi:hypothetical protein